MIPEQQLPGVWLQVALPGQIVLVERAHVVTQERDGDDERDGLRIARSAAGKRLSSLLS